jgi:hypothetical protein
MVMVMGVAAIFDDPSSFRFGVTTGENRLSRFADNASPAVMPKITTAKARVKIMLKVFSFDLSISIGDSAPYI